MKKLFKCLLTLSLVVTSILGTGFRIESLKATGNSNEYLVSEDAYIRSDKPTSSYNYESITNAHGPQYVGKDFKVLNSKYGNSTNSTNSTNIIALMKLPLPTQEEIKQNGYDTYKFVFNIFKNADYTTGDQIYHFYYTTETNWSETSVTWKNKPESVKRDAENLLFDFEILKDYEYESKTDEEKRITVDITDTVEKLVDNGVTAITVFAVAKNRMNTSLMLHSKESGNDDVYRGAKIVAIDTDTEYKVSEDAYIRSDKATSSYNYESITNAHGSQYVGKDFKVLNSKYRDGTNIIALMKLPLPTQEEIEQNGYDTYKFVFNIFKNANHTTGDQIYHFYYTTETEWNEKDVTWNNKPKSVNRDAENLLFDFEIKKDYEYESKTDEEKRITVDITDTVEKLVENGVTAITVFAVAKNSMNTSLMLHSRESGKDGVYRGAELVASKSDYSQEKLAKLIKECEALDALDYTTESFENLQNEIDDAKTVNEKTDATTAEIREAYKKLLAAKDALVSSKDPADLQNVAYGKPTRSNLDKNNTYKVTDGDLTTSWQGKFFPSYVDVDLMDTYKIDDIELYFPAGKAFYYTVYGSNDGKDYTEIYQSRSDEKKTAEADIIKPASECHYRILRVYVEYNDTNAQSILSEIRVHGTKMNTNTEALRTGTFEEITGIEAFDNTEYAKEITVEETIENVYGIIDRTVGAEYRDWFTFEIAPNTENDYDYFELSDVNGKVHIKGNEGLSLATGLNYYYKNYINVQISEQTMQVNMPENIVPIGETVRKETAMKVRYAFNYCTLSYTFAFFGEEEWQRENDWLALNGVNVVLDLAGQEATWIKFLMNYGYSYDDAKDWLVGPGYYAWQFMDNMEVFGGPIPDGYVIDRVELARSSQRWKRSLGMDTVLQGYAGMVPTDFGTYNTDIQIISQGNWNGFSRPNMIATDSEAYDEMAKKFYECQKFVYGETTDYYAVDPFHEGGIRPKGLTDDIISKEVLESMLKYDADAVWTVQGWQSNPTDKLLEGMGDYREDHVLIVDLIKYPLLSSGEAQYKKNEFHDTSWAWCLLGNFGGNPTMNGEIQTMVDDIQNAKKNSNHMIGIGIISEATYDNPMIYDLIFDLAWTDDSFDLDKWMNQYLERRYGGISENVKMAWDLIESANYSQGVRLTPELFGVRTGGVPRNIGKKSIGYDSQKLEQALRLLLRDFDQFKDSSGYRYDLTEIMRQVVSNYTVLKYSDVIDARDAKDLELFRTKKAEFLNAFDVLNEVAATQKDQLGGEWIGKAQDRAADYDDFSKSAFEMNAKSLITTWGSIGGSLVDYGFRTYEGMFIDVRKANWVQYLDQVEQNLIDGSSITTPTSASGYARPYWKNWVVADQNYTRDVKDTPEDLLAVSQRVMSECVFTGELDPNIGNIALNRQVISSGTVNAGTAQYATDGKIEKIFTVSSKNNQSPEVIIDLLGVFDLSGINVILSEDCAYEVYVSIDNESWIKVAEKVLGSYDEAGDVFDSLSTTARYVKLVGTDQLAIHEIRAYGSRALPNLEQLAALVKTVEGFDLSAATEQQISALKEALKTAQDAIKNQEAPDTVNTVFWNLYDKATDIDLYAEINIALKKPVTAHNGSSGYSQNLVDGSNSYWDSGRLSPPGLPYEDKITPGWAIIDLQGLKTISEIKLTFDNQNIWYQYELYTSLNGEDWTLVGEKKTENKPNSDEDNYDLDNQYARFIKIITTNISLETSGRRYGYRISELVALGRNVVLNKENLKALIQSVESLKQDDYKVSSWNELQNALENANAVYEDEFVVPEDIEKAEQDLAYAIDGLEEIERIPWTPIEPAKPDKSDLEKAVEDAKDIDLDKYTDITGTVLEKAIADAEKVLADDKATQEDVNYALEVLNKAVEGLVEAEQPVDPVEPTDPTDPTEPVEPEKPSQGNTEVDVPTVNPKEEVKEVTVGVEDAKKTEDILNESIKDDKVLGPLAEKAIQEGKNVTISVIPTLLNPAKVSAEVKEEIEKIIFETSKNDLTVAQYLDITVHVMADNQPLGNLTSTKEKLKFQIAIPEDLKKEGRTFIVFRIHDGKVEKLETVEKDGLLVFESDQFSTYALAYKDTETTKPSAPNTSDHLMILNFVVMTILSGLIFVVLKKRTSFEK